MAPTRVCLLAVLFVVTAVPCVLGDGVIRDGLGAVSIGRGGTNIASADNGEILLDNPAGMVNLEGKGLVDLGVDTLMTDLQYSDLQNPSANAWHDPFPIPEASAIWKSDDGVWAFGMGVFAPAGFAVNWDLEGPPALPGMHDYKSLGAMAKLLPGVAYRVNDRLSVGATLGMGLAHTELQGPYFLQSPGPLQGTPTLMRLFTTGVALSWSVGLQYQLTETTTIGATFESATHYSQTGGANIDVPALPFPSCAPIEQLRRQIRHYVARKRGRWPPAEIVREQHFHRRRHLFQLVDRFRPLQRKPHQSHQPAFWCTTGAQS